MQCSNTGVCLECLGQVLQRLVSEDAILVKFHSNFGSNCVQFLFNVFLILVQFVSNFFQCLFLILVQFVSKNVKNLNGAVASKQVGIVRCSNVSNFCSMSF